MRRGQVREPRDRQRRLPTVSLTNHSCAQNTMRYHEGNACVLRAVRTIEAGEEITDNYGFFYQGGNSVEN